MSIRDGRDGRGRPRRDYSSKSEEKSHHGRGRNPPSRHLWVGNLPLNLTENTLAHHFLQFGDLETIAFQPGRSYAFLNYRNEEDAFAAVKELQGFVIAGSPLKIEFAKPEKMSIPPRDAAYSEGRDGPYTKSRESLYSHRDSRGRHSSPDLSHPDKSKMDDKDAEPSEVLWVGFPAQLKMDEFVLRKAFSPFGEIEKITAFPGRTYAFVRFRNVMSACRAKEKLHGRLFGNPRVHICFAKNESGPPDRERISMRSPRFRSYEYDESFENFRSDQKFYSGDPSVRSPPFTPHPDRGDRDMMGLARNDFWPGGADPRERRRHQGHGSELGLPGIEYEPLDSPKRRGDYIGDFSPRNYPRRDPLYDDPWDLPEDVSLLHGAKKLKTDTTSVHDNELPEYPLCDLEKSKRVVSRDIPRSGVVDMNYDSRYSGRRPIPPNLMNITQTFGERDRNSSHDEFPIGSVQFPPVERRRLTPEIRQSSSKEMWKWEGMIAKGGTSVCRARCFPVGTPPEMVLPEYLDCTARTSLDMLAKHYYQASSAWVVFFTPANDPDISYYNEFMNYLGEKQRAAVVKLDETTTLFLVPPSEFSEKVLKVPGKLSISGVVLMLDTPGSSYGSIPQNEIRETSLSSFQKPISPSGPYLPTRPLTNYDKPRINIAPTNGNLPFDDVRSSIAQGHYDYGQESEPRPNWPHHDFQNSISVNKNMTSQGTMGHPYPRPTQEEPRTSFAPDNNTPDYRSGGNSKFPIMENSQISGGQQGYSGGVSNIGEYKPSGNFSSEGSLNYRLPNEQASSSDFQQSQFGQIQQQSESLALFQNPVQDEAETDPQKRLQATLQLAAALLQQIQQGKGM